MRILFAGRDLDRPRGGGEISARTLLSALRARHEVVVRNVSVESGGRREPYQRTLLRAESGARDRVRRALEEVDPDLVVLQQPATLRPEDLGDRRGLVVFLRSLVCFGIAEPSPDWTTRVSGLAFRRLRLARNLPLLRRADVLLVNSRYLRGEVECRIGLEPHVVSPFIDTSPLRRVRGDSTAEGAITFAGLDSWKGAATALRIAARLPERRFLFLEGARPDVRHASAARRLANVSVLPWRDDLREVFRRTRLLIAPSLWPEPFGRLPVEAGACGIPTIASRSGGLAEAVGGGGLLVPDARDVTAWIEAIRRLDDRQVYASLAEKARENARGLDAAVTVECFRHVVREALRVDI